MDTLPLPPRPDLAQYRKRAKELVKASASAEPAAVGAWSADWLETLARLRGVTVSPFVQGSFDRAVEVIEQRVRERSTRGRFTLADAQFLMARGHGFASWRDFAGHVEGLPISSGRDRPASTAPRCCTTWPRTASRTFAS